jgi:hypothetical protein
VAHVRVVSCAAAERKGGLSAHELISMWARSLQHQTEKTTNQLTAELIPIWRRWFYSSREKRRPIRKELSLFSGPSYSCYSTEKLLWQSFNFIKRFFSLLAGRLYLLFQLSSQLEDIPGTRSWRQGDTWKYTSSPFLLSSSSLTPHNLCSA